MAEGLGKSAEEYWRITGVRKNMAKHNKRIHNGKDRLTGRKLPRRTEPKAIVKARSVGRGHAFIPISRTKRPTLQRCNCTPEQRELVNQRLYAELGEILPLGTWNELTGAWERKHSVIPRYFARKYSKHMHHFRPYARERREL